MKLLAKLTSFFAWLQIAAAPVLLGGLLALGLLCGIPSPTGLLLAVLVGGAGLGLGIWWAERVRRQAGTVAFMARLSDSPDAAPADQNPTPTST